MKPWKASTINSHCGVSENLIPLNEVFIGVYKYYTMLKSLIKLDWILNLFFILTVHQFQHEDTISNFEWYVLVPFGSELILVSYTAFMGIKAIKNRDSTTHKQIGILRIIIEAIKLI